MDEIPRSTEPSAEPQFLQSLGSGTEGPRNSAGKQSLLLEGCWGCLDGSADNSQLTGMSHPVRGRHSLSQAGRERGLLASTLIRAQMKIKRLEIQCTVWNCVFLGKI